MGTSHPTHVLDGYKILDFTQFIAGPTVTRMMAQMGAEVIKVEIAPGGDRTRELPLVRDGRSGYFVQQNLGKLSLCVDLKNSAGLAIVKELVPKVDVVVENFAPGVIARMGLGYEVVRALNPRAVMCSVSTFGQQGPLAHLPGYDFIAQAYSGITHMIGEEDGPPYFPTAALGDVSTGVHGALAVVAALLHRERTGEGQHLDVALLDAYFHCHHTAIQMYSLSGGRIKPRRTGHHISYGAPCGMFKGHRRYLIIVAGVDHQWNQLCDAMGRPELKSDERFANNQRRTENLSELVRIIEGWIAEMPDDEAAIARLAEYRVPVAPVLSPDEAMALPHLRERGTLTTVNDPILGEFELPGFPLHFSNFPEPAGGGAPLLGEHNEDVLGRYLGYPRERVRELERAAILHRASR
ncbi:MAG TPA: CoA transferase [Candidatus Binataceae bacterium]|nr:CoA transferase [Candidatus Binataceae bacterium]